MSRAIDPDEPPRTTQPAWRAYVMAVAAVTAFVLVRLALRPILGREAPLLLLTVPVAIAGYVGGLWPGLVATAVAVVMGATFLLEHEGAPWVTRGPDRAALALFAVTGAIVSALSEGLHRARSRAEQASAAAVASRQNARRTREEQTHAATQLRHSEENFRLLVEGVQDYAIFMLDPDGRIATWNEGARRLKGYGALDAVGKPFTVFYEKQDVEAGIPARNLALAADHGVFEGQGWRVRNDGSRFYADVAITALRDEHGVLRGYAKVTRDITDRRAAEDALRQSESKYRELAEALERRVVERTAQLEEANAQLEAFAYSISHDLRAPLRAVQGFAQALLEDYGDKLDDTGKEYAGRAVSAAAEMDQLIRDLLEYSRIARREFPLQRVNLRGAARGVLAQSDADPRARGADVTADVDDFEVTANPAVLAQVLANLVGNAVKFVRPGDKPSVRLTCRRLPDGFVRVNVSDNGIGIAPQHQKRIFNVFERLHGGEEYPGTGIGLAIVRRGVERMGGRYGVESDLGRGSTFWIDLPAAAGEEVSPAPPTVATSDGAS